MFILMPTLAASFPLAWIALPSLKDRATTLLRDKSMQYIAEDVDDYQYLMVDVPRAQCDSKTYTYLVAQSLANANDLEIKELQGRDERSDFDQMEAHWVSDDVKQVNHGSDDSIRVCINADHYIDIPSLLAKHKRPYVFLTSLPCRSASAHKKTMFTFDYNDELVNSASDGRVYRHPLWNYYDNYFLASNRDIFGITTELTRYSVTVIRHSILRATVVLMPLQTVKGRLRCFLYKYWCQTRELTRYSPVRNTGCVRTDYVKDEVRYTSLCTPNCYDTLDVETRLLDQLRALYTVNTKNFSIATVQSNTQLTRGEAARVYLYIVGAREITHIPLTDAVKQFEIEPDGNMLVNQPPMRAICNPIVNGAYTPAITKQNERACIEGRITRPNKHLTATRSDKALAELFVKTMCARENFRAETISDTSLVFARQARPTQRKILTDALYKDDPEMIKMFLKREAYAKVTDPRPISILPGQWKLHYSAVIYSITEQINNTSWYAFGKTPAELAHAVTECLKDAQTAINGDYSRFDGTVTTKLRAVDRAVIKYMIAPSDQKESHKLYEKQVGVKGTSRHGVRFETDGQQGSGSADTALFNSLRGKFIQFCTLLKMGKSPAEAYAHPGLFGGDDSLVPDLDAQTYINTASEWGLTLEAEPAYRGHLGVTFLSRYYGPDVWYGNPNSCCDILRQCSKLHTTTQMPSSITNEHLFYTKIMGFYLTDKNTPIIGDIARHAIIGLGKPSAYTDHDEINRLVRPWFSNSDTSQQYPNVYEDWMAELVFNTMPEFSYDTLLDHLHNQKSWKTFLNFPLCMREGPENDDTPYRYQLNDKIYGKSPKHAGATIEKSIVSKGNNSKQTRRKNVNNSHNTGKASSSRSRSRTARRTTSAPAPTTRR